MNPETHVEGHPISPRTARRADALSATTLWRSLEEGARMPAQIRRALCEEDRGRPRGERLAQAIINAGITTAELPRMIRHITTIQKSETIRVIDRADAWGDLVKVLSRGTHAQRVAAGPTGAVDLYFAQKGGAELTIDCLNGIANSPKTVRETPGQDIPSFIAIMTRYDGTPENLRTFIERVGKGRITGATSNPFLAAQEVQVLAGGALNGDEIKAVGAEGHMIKRPYRAFHPSNPELTFVSGKEALLKILATFNPQDFSRETIEKKRGERQAHDNSFLAGVTLDDLLDPSTDAAVRRSSHLIARHLEVVTELQAHITALRSALLRSGEPTPAASSLFSTLKSYSGGTMLNYLEEHREELPPNIKEALDLFTDPVTRLAEKDRALVGRGLLAYFLGTQAKFARRVLTDLTEDLATYRELQAKDPTWVTRHGLPPVDLTQHTEHLAKLHAGDRAEVTIAESAEIYQALSFLIEFREKRNREVTQTFSTELPLVEDLARRFFMRIKATPVTQGETHYEWRSDSLSDSVPMKRLEREQCEVAKLFDGAAVLNRDDLAALKELLHIQIYGAKEALHLRSYSSIQYSAIIEHAVSALRKVQAFEQQLIAAGITERAPEKIPALLVEHNLTIHVLSRGTFIPEEIVAQRLGMPPAALVERLEWLTTTKALPAEIATSATMRWYLQHKDLLHTALEARLFPSEIPGIEQSIAELRSLEPAHDHAVALGALERLRQMQKQPEYPGLSLQGWIPWESNRFLYPHQRAAIAKVAELVATVESTYTPELRKKLQRVGQFQGTHLFRVEGGSFATHTLDPLRVGTASQERFDTVTRAEQLTDGVQARIVDASRVDSLLEYLTNGTIPRAEIPTEFFAKFDRIRQSRTTDLPRELAIPFIRFSGDSRALELDQKFRIDRALYDQIMHLTLPEVQKPANYELIPGKIALRDGEPVALFGRQGEIRGKSLLDLPLATLRVTLDATAVPADVKMLVRRILTLKTRHQDATELRHAFWAGVGAPM